MTQSGNKKTQRTEPTASTHRSTRQTKACTQQIQVTKLSSTHTNPLYLQNTQTPIKTHTNLNTQTSTKKNHKQPQAKNQTQPPHKPRPSSIYHPNSLPKIRTSKQPLSNHTYT
ncbi:hypothetical protein CFOL_v3_34615 [Cephalotus follicularis]|uniref:Uncharacterized protein n=1 Tax=Cephalotus follicularis TaxID=3775 RepID=A0A1Q3DFA8_CEPFO|nr:hypothetical protein CFOL_v3_34615 [Cephalotus follicularis]